MCQVCTAGQMRKDAEKGLVIVWKSKDPSARGCAPGPGVVPIRERQRGDITHSSRGCINNSLKLKTCF